MPELHTLKTTLTVEVTYDNDDEQVLEKLRHMLPGATVAVKSGAAGQLLLLLQVVKSETEIV